MDGVWRREFEVDTMQLDLIDEAIEFLAGRDVYINSEYYPAADQVHDVRSAIGGYTRFFVRLTSDEPQAGACFDAAMRAWAVRNNN